jgi:hypothetical protein
LKPKNRAGTDGFLRVLEAKKAESFQHPKSASEEGVKKGFFRPKFSTDSPLSAREKGGF